MLCAQPVARVVRERDVQSTASLAEAHVIVGSAPVLAGPGSAPISLYLSHPRAKADAGRFVAEEPNQPCRIIRVSVWKRIHCPQTVLSSKQALRTLPVLLWNVGQSPGEPKRGFTTCTARGLHPFIASCIMPGREAIQRMFSLPHFNI